MAATRLKQKLSTIVQSQLPEFIQADFPTFIAFIKAYYEFLEQDSHPQEVIQNTRLYQDVDFTIDSFIKYFKQTYCNDIPEFAVFDRKTLIKKIKDLYERKGSEASYRLLFRLLYNKEIEFFYPATQILKASDGKWKQEYSIFIEVIFGDINSIVKKNLIIRNDQTRFPIYIFKKRQVTTSKGINASVFECFFDNSKNVPILLNDVIEYEGFKGRVVSVPTSASVYKPGSGFRVGDILNVTSGDGVEAKLKVTDVGTNGAIESVEFLKFGYGYVGDFYNFFTAQKRVPRKSTFNFDIPGGTVSITDQTEGFIERGTVTTPNYAELSCFAEDYSGDLLQTFFTSTFSESKNEIDSSIGADSDAAIFISQGIKTKYPGYFLTNDGFLSDEMYLENQEYYQPYSYVIKIDELLESYKKVVKDILHPAGMRLLGEFSLEAKLNLATSILDSLRLLISRFQDFKYVVDDGNSKDITKILSDFSDTQEAIVKDITAPKSELQELIDNTLLLINQNNSDNVVISESNSKNIDKLVLLEDYAVDYFLENYSEAAAGELIALEDLPSILFNSSFDDDISPIQDSISKETSPFFSSDINLILDNITNTLAAGVNDSQPLSDIDAKTTSQIRLDTTGVDDVLTANNNINITIESFGFTDFGDIFLIDYVDSSYLAEIYVGSIILNF